MNQKYPTFEQRPKCIWCGTRLKPEYKVIPQTKTLEVCTYVLNTARCTRTANHAIHDRKHWNPWMGAYHEFVPGGEQVVSLPSVVTNEVRYFGHADTKNLFCTLKCATKWAVRELNREAVKRSMELTKINRERPDRSSARSSAKREGKR